ncbi:MAG: hypothetical protein ACLP9L_30760, partial [Thermoguttaceae bacterium]
MTIILVIAGSTLVRAAEKPNPTGTWKWEAKFNEQTFDMTRKLKLDGKRLTGAKIGPDGQEIAIEDAKCADDKVSFSVVREFNGQKMTFKYTGKVTGDTIEGELKSKPTW